MEWYCAGVRPSVRLFTLPNINISDTRGSIVIKFYHKQHWGGVKAALGMGADRIRTLVSMATNSFQIDRVMMSKTVSLLFLGCFSANLFYTCR